MNKMKEETIMLKLLMLQQRWNPIFHIVTDQGSNQRDPEMQGIKNSTGETYRILAMLHASINAAAYNQRANTVEAHIKKMMFLTRTLGSEKFKDICSTMKPDAFELLLEYLQTSMYCVP